MPRPQNCTEPGARSDISYPHRTWSLHPPRPLPILSVYGIEPVYFPRRRWRHERQRPEGGPVAAARRRVPGAQARRRPGGKGPGQQGGGRADVASVPGGSVGRPGRRLPVLPGPGPLGLATGHVPARRGAGARPYTVPGAGHREQSVCYQEGPCFLPGSIDAIRRLHARGTGFTRHQAPCGHEDSDDLEGFLVGMKVLRLCAPLRPRPDKHGKGGARLLHAGLRRRRGRARRRPGGRRFAVGHLVGGQGGREGGPGLGCATGPPAERCPHQKPGGAARPAGADIGLTARVRSEMGGRRFLAITRPALIPMVL